MIPRDPEGVGHNSRGVSPSGVIQDIEILRQAQHDKQDEIAALRPPYRQAGRNDGVWACADSSTSLRYAQNDRTD